ncbi:M16 family metallopeptidase [Arcticibacterium luteifluviistationis]|uniref:Peptidase M16 n=1 Tax=Arcticibacterium luteifluviistationis TaxID=1784714 RepID=A0A2Z4GIL0_9BACT|nr:pitrilysin family protein [Arcticibacterium luteifluviistationis]AWW00965.1 peptidase M16 [Arcticibacterium luteifluviistationis]
MNEYSEHTLPNGIRLAHRQVTHTKIVHCGIMLDIGSRDEKPHQVGLAHFWEHMAFKGTKKRKSYHIINKLEVVGGELNAYTTKEKICFYASVLDNHFDKAIDILSDITFHSIFPERQIEKERGVILEEMSMYLDSPEDSIQDELDSVIFPNHTLGNNILGTKETIQSFTQTDLKNFVQENLNTDKIIVSVVGNISFKKAIRLVEKHLKDIPAINNESIRTKPSDYKSQSLSLEKPINQAHVALGIPSYSLHNKNRFAYFTLIHLLGGSGMNSRLNASLREKHGLVYGIDANYTAFTDSGYTSIFYATEPKNLKKANQLVFKEINQLKTKSLGSLQLKNLKEQLMGQLAMSDESNQSFMLMMAKSLLDLNKVNTLEEVFSKIKIIEASDLRDLALEALPQQDFSNLTYMATY